MNSCSNSGIQEMLPDFLHGTLEKGDRQRVEAHLAGCESCRQELRVLTAVRSAAVFAPQIDANRVVDQIAPYRRIDPALERPAPPRFVTWLVAASLAVLVAGGGSVLLTRGPSPSETRAVATSAPRSTAPSAVAIPDSPVRVPASATTDVGAEHSIALAADVDGLSDGGL